MIVDLYSRNVVGWEVFHSESAHHARRVIERAVLAERVIDQPLVLLPHPRGAPSRRGSTDPGPTPRLAPGGTGRTPRALEWANAQLGSHHGGLAQSRARPRTHVARSSGVTPMQATTTLTITGCTLRRIGLTCLQQRHPLQSYSEQHKWERAMRVVDFSEARNSLKNVIDQVIDDADYTIIVRRDAPDAVVMSLDTFNSLMETVHLLKSPANAAHLARSIEQYRQGRVTQHELIDAG